VGDYVQDLEIYDGGTDPATLISSAWTNITQGTTLAGAPPANTLVPLSGTGLTDAQLRATPVPVTIGALPTSIYSNQLTVSLTAQALASQTFANGVVLSSSANNTGNIYIGPVGVTASTGYLLVPGQAISYAVENSNVIYALGTNTTDVLSYTGN
jgi:hypothetical protein